MRQGQLDAVAKRLFGWNELRAEQRDAMQAVLDGRCPGPCKSGDRCDERADSGTPYELALSLNARVQQREWGRGVVLSGESDRIAVLFDEYGYRTLSMAAVGENGLLTVVDQ